MTDYPDTLRYAAEHEWIAAEPPFRVGITRYAADALGDVVYIDPPAVGTTVTAGSAFGEIESTKSVSDLYAPATGVVTEINEAAVADPSIVNDDPYGSGWLYVLEVSEPAPTLSAEEYQALVDAKP
ncbi:glycine cleavage system protein GcvH [Planctomonas psychrotolerans]|uniref:glycine cleavage system protein GcvH n=1 Tax=Planctomonas psychrotolerans TaxID=2528712 RepID=UPI0012387D19|nr:glycine cleavage system protein GcvH [Planctomonas psychrotolerans]